MTATAVSKSFTFYFAVLPTGSKPDDINKKHCNEISRYACNSRFSVCLVYQTQAVHPDPLDFPTLVAHKTTSRPAHNGK